MKPRPLPKPIWYQYAEYVRAQLDGGECRGRQAKREGRSELELIMWSYRAAVDEKRYPGTFLDWNDLLTRLGLERKRR